MKLSFVKLSFSPFMICEPQRIDGVSMCIISDSEIK